MTTVAVDLFRATRAEVFKLRRTLALWAAFLCPLVVIAMTAAVILTRDPGRVGGANRGPWDTLTFNFVFFLWCLIGLPLFVALETALLAGLEHHENAWKHLFALPIGRWSIYVAKLLVAAALVATSSLVLAAGVGLEGLVMLSVRPDLGLTLPIPWETILRSAASFAAAALLLLAVQAWVATHWHSFTIALGLGIVGTIAGLVLSLSVRSAGVASLFPWSIPFATIGRGTPADSPDVQLRALLVGVVGGLIVAIAGGWATSRGDVQ
jgi:hypothetical protein